MGNKWETRQGYEPCLVVSLENIIGDAIVPVNIGSTVYGKSIVFRKLLTPQLLIALLHGKSDFAKAGQKKNAANCDVSNCFFYEETRELYSPVVSLLASSIPFAVADRIFKSFSLMPSSMVSS